MSQSDDHIKRAKAAKEYAAAVAEIEDRHAKIATLQKQIDGLQGDITNFETDRDRLLSELNGAGAAAPA